MLFFFSGVLLCAPRWGRTDFFRARERKGERASFPPSRQSKLDFALMHARSCTLFASPAQPRRMTNQGIPEKLGPAGITDLALLYFCAEISIFRWALFIDFSNRKQITFGRVKFTVLLLRIVFVLYIYHHVCIFIHRRWMGCVARGSINLNSLLEKMYSQRVCAPKRLVKCLNTTFIRRNISSKTWETRFPLTMCIFQRTLFSARIYGGACSRASLNSGARCETSLWLRHLWLLAFANEKWMEVRLFWEIAIVFALNCTL